MKLNKEHRLNVINDFKIYHGLPPHENNPCVGDPLFGKGMEKRHGMSLADLEKAVNFKSLLEAWNRHRREFKAIDDKRLKAIMDIGMDPFAIAPQLEMWWKAVSWHGAPELRKQLAKAGFNVPIFIQHLKCMAKRLGSNK